MENKVKTYRMYIDESGDRTKSTTSIYIRVKSKDMGKYFWGDVCFKQKSPLRDFFALAQSGYPPPSKWIDPSVAGIEVKIH